MGWVAGCWTFSCHCCTLHLRNRGGNWLCRIEQLFTASGHANSKLFMYSNKGIHTPASLNNQFGNPLKDLLLGAGPALLSSVSGVAVRRPVSCQALFSCTGKSESHCFKCQAYVSTNGKAEAILCLPGVSVSRFSWKR